MLGFYIPTVFAPNADGHNDIYKPMLFGNVKQYRFAIYDQWGTIVSNLRIPEEDGMERSPEQYAGNTVFVWTCTYQFEGMEVKTEKGTVTLVK